MSLQFSTTQSAFWSVAPKMGIDLTEAIRSERLAPEVLSAMLRNCSQCWHGRKCERWLKAANDAPMPDFCPSSATLNDLAGHSAGPDTVWQ